MGTTETLNHTSIDLYVTRRNSQKSFWKQLGQKLAQNLNRNVKRSV